MIDRWSYGPIASIDIWDFVAYAEHVKYSFAPVGGRRRLLDWGGDGLTADGATG